MKRLEKILDALEERVNGTIYDELYGVGKPVVVGNTTAWIEDYDISYNTKNNTFTVCVYSKNNNECPNVEKYLSEELEKRIPDLRGLVLEAKEEMRREEESIRDTERTICRLNGWSY